MNTEDLLEPSVQNYIHCHRETDVISFSLKASPFAHISSIDLTNQIQGWQKIKKKIPSWYQDLPLLFPPKLNLEQTSSQITAIYKSSIINGETLIDLTGGFGVDTFFLAQSFAKTIHLEQNQSLSILAKHNFEVLNQHNIQCIVADSMKWLRESSAKFDWIYIDPARRSSQGKKVIRLSEYEPNLVDGLDELFEHTQQVLVKTSPMYDIQAGIAELKHATYIHIVAVQNEVKELLFILNKGVKKTPQIKCINFSKETTQEFEVSLNAEEYAQVQYDEPKTYLYEPNAAIMKSGQFNSLAEAYQLYKLHPNSQLYTSDNLIDFPGRRFKIEAVLPYTPKKIKKLFSGKKANITVRNFDNTVSELRKKFTIHDGGTDYLFFTTNFKNKRLLLKTTKA